MGVSMTRVGRLRPIARLDGRGEAHTTSGDYRRRTCRIRRSPLDWQNRREGQQSTEPRHVVPSKRYMGKAPLVYSVVVHQRQADIAEQQDVIGDTGVSRRK